MNRTTLTTILIVTVIGLTLGPVMVGTVAADHAEGDPPDDPGNNGSEVPGVGRPPCIPPDDPGHGQPSCIPPEAPPGQGGENPGNGGGGSSSSSSQGLSFGLSLLGL